MLVALDVAVGLVFIYLVLSLLCTAAMEFLAASLQLRATHLRNAVTRLLDTDLADALYGHPLVNRLSEKGKAPHYIESARFAQAVAEVLVSRDPKLGNAVTLESLKKSLEETPGGNAEVEAWKKALRSLLARAEGNLDAFRAGLADWFDDAMRNLSGVYKRKTQWITLGLGMALALVLNVDTIHIAHRLSTDSTMREALAGAAVDYLAQDPVVTAPPAGAEPAPDPVKAVGEASKRFEQRYAAVSALSANLGLPMGWTNARLSQLGFSIDGQQAPPQSAWGLVLVWLTLLAGCALTAAAVSFGAPFWFDVLSKIVTVRSAIKPAPAQPAAAAAGAAGATPLREVG